MTNEGSIMPDWNLSEECKARLVWLAQECGAGLSEALDIIIDFYQQQELKGISFKALREILHLRENCEAAEIPVEDLRNYLRDRAKLKDRGLTVQDVPRAIETADALRQLNLPLEETAAVVQTWRGLQNAKIDLGDLPKLKESIKTVRTLAEMPKADVQALAELHTRMRALKITAEQLKDLVSFHEKLIDAGFTQERAELFASALKKMRDEGVSEKRATQEISSYLSESISLKESMTALQAKHNEKKKQVDDISAQVAQITRQKNSLEQTCMQLRQEINQNKVQLDGMKKEMEELKVLRENHALIVAYALGLEEFLLSGKVEKYHAFWKVLALVLQAKEQQGFWNAPAPPEIEQEARKQLLLIVRRILEPDLVAKWEIDHFRKMAKIEAREALRDEHKNIVEKLESAVKILRDASPELSIYLNKIKYPNA